jgi:hypothetical protein
MYGDDNMVDYEYKNKIIDCLKNNKHECLYNKKGKTLNTVIEIIYDDLNNFDYNVNSDITYLNNAWNVVVAILAKNMSLQNSLFNELKNIHALMVKLIHSKPEEFDSIAKEKYIQLK